MGPWGMSSRHVAAAIGALLALTGCTSGGSDPEVQPTPTEPTSPRLAVPDATPLKNGVDFDVVSRPLPEVRGQRATFDGVTTDGEIYGSTVTLDLPVDDPDLVASFGSVVLVDAVSGQVTMVSDGTKRPAQTRVIGVAADQRWVSWIESPTVKDGDWTLYSYDRETARTRKVVTSNLAGKYGELVEAAPRITGGRVSVDLKVADGATVRLRTKLDGTGKPAAAPRRMVTTDSTCGDVRAGSDSLTCSSTDDGTAVDVVGEDDAAGEDTYGPFDGKVSKVRIVDGWAQLVEGDGDDAITYAIDIERKQLHVAKREDRGWRLMGHGYALETDLLSDGTARSYELIRLR